MAELLRLTRMYRDLWGSALWVKERNTAGGIARLVPYAADEFEVVPDPDDLVLYHGFRLSHTADVIPREEAIFWRETNPYDWDTGIAPAEVIRDTMSLERRADLTVADLLRNAVFPSLAVEVDKEWSPNEDEWAHYIESIQQHKYPERKGGVLILQAARTRQLGSMNITEALPAGVVDRIEAKVGMVFGVPPVVLGMLTGLKNSPWSNMRQAHRQAILDTIEPMWANDQSTLDRQLLHAPTEAAGRPLDPDPSTHIHFDRSNIRGLEPDLEIQSRISAENRDVLTVNERRMLIGKDPLPEGDERGLIIVGLQSAEPAPVTPSEAGAAA